MVFFESHSMIHGRPFPLKGKHFVNYNIHFALKHGGYPEGRDADSTVPMYIVPGSIEAQRLDIKTAASNGDWDALELYKRSGKEEYLHQPISDGWLPLHYAANNGEMDALRLLLDHTEHGVEYLKEQNDNGQTPLSLAKARLWEAQRQVDKLRDSIAYMEAKRKP